MAKCNTRENNPVRYAKVKAEQERLQSIYDITPTLVVECPYCGHMIGRLFKGQHAGIEQKCSKCGEIIIFPPVSFSKAKT